MSSTQRVILTLAIALGVTGAGLFGQEATPAATGAPIEMTARNYDFNPPIIKVKQGDRVKLVITATDRTHGIKIAAYQINQRLDKGVATTVEFTADRAGTFPFQCSVMCGLGHGRMKGQLIVEPSGTATAPAAP